MCQEPCQDNEVVRIRENKRKINKYLNFAMRLASDLEQDLRPQRSWRP